MAQKKKAPRAGEDRKSSPAFPHERRKKPRDRTKYNHRQMTARDK